MQVSDIIDYQLTRKGLWIVYNSCEGEKEIDLNPEETVYLLKGADYIVDYSAHDGLMMVTISDADALGPSTKDIEYAEWVMFFSLDKPTAADLAWCHERVINNKAA